MLSTFVLSVVPMFGSTKFGYSLSIEKINTSIEIYCEFDSSILKSRNFQSLNRDILEWTMGSVDHFKPNKTYFIRLDKSGNTIKCRIDEEPINDKPIAVFTLSTGQLNTKLMPIIIEKLLGIKDAKKSILNYKKSKQCQLKLTYGALPGQPLRSWCVDKR